MIRNFCFGLMGAIALASAANAADMYRAPEGGGLKDAPYVPVNGWTGFYAGVNGGLASSATNDVFDFLPGGPKEIKPSGGFGGGQIGYNWQGIWQPHLVIGVEADIQGAGIDDAITAPSFGAFLQQSKLDWFGTVRGRLGYAMDGTLLYATGGFAYGGLDKTDHFGPADFRFNGTATGYAIGGGIEQRISPAWSLKGEYQYLNFGKNDLTDPVFGSFTNNFGGARLHDDDFHTVRVGLNYHFGQDYAGGGGLKDAPFVLANSRTGFYAGVNGGLASSGTNDVLDFTSLQEREIKPSGGFGGGQIGYNWQVIWQPHLVLGVEADIQGARIADASDASGAIGAGAFSEQSKLDWFGTVRGRLGYDMDGTLLYATGGFAYGGLDKTDIFPLIGVNFKSSGTATGYAVGGGIEQRISPAWSLKGEYQYLNFGKNDLTDPNFGSFAAFFHAKLHDDDFHTVRIGLNYHFVPDATPLK